MSESYPVGSAAWYDARVRERASQAYDDKLRERACRIHDAQLRARPSRKEEARLRERASRARRTTPSPSSGFGSFIVRLWDRLERGASIRWKADGRSFEILDLNNAAQEMGIQVASLKRALGQHGFKRRPSASDDGSELAPNAIELSHPSFLRHDRDASLRVRAPNRYVALGRGRYDFSCSSFEDDLCDEWRGDGEEGRAASLVGTSVPVEEEESGIGSDLQLGGTTCAPYSKASREVDVAWELFGDAVWWRPPCGPQG